MTIQFANNADTKLAAPVGVGDGTLQVVSTAGFPAVSVDNPCYVTLQQAPTDPANPPLDPKIEICLCTGIAGNTLTVARGQDGTSAKSFIVGDYVEGRIVRASLNEFLQKADAQDLLDDKANQADLDIHIGDNTNPHQVTAAQVGADPAGSADTVQGNLDTHVGDLANPHEVTAAQVGAEPELGNPATDGQVLASTTAGVRGWVTVGGGSEGEANTTSNEGTGEGLALAKAGINLPFKTLLAESAVVTLTPTAEEIVIGVDESVIVHANLNGAGVYPHGTIDSHIDSTANPHDVTAAQVGAATVGDLTDHINDTNNPHSVTTAQIGAENALGNPAEDGQVLISTAAGVRSWAKIGGGLTISDTPPPAPDRGDLWLDSSTADMITYVWYDDGNSQQWVVQSDPFATANSAIIPNPAAGVSQSITAADPADVPLTVKGAALQTANLFAVQDSAGTSLLEVGPTGAAAIQPTDPALTCLTVKAPAAQSTHWINCRDSTDQSIFRVNQFGRITTFGGGCYLNCTDFYGSTGPAFGFNIGAGVTASEGMEITNGEPSLVPFSARGAALQTANILEVRSNAGDVLNGFDANGELIKGAPVKRTRVTISVNQTIANATGTYMLWELVDGDDTGGFWLGDVGGAVFTIPAGVTKVRFHASIRWNAQATGDRLMTLQKWEDPDSITVVGGIRAAMRAPTAYGPTINGASSAIDVTPGDQFLLLVSQTSGANLAVLADETTWFEIEEVR